MNDASNNVKSIVQSSSLINPKEQIYTSEELNRLYQASINEKIFSNKQRMIDIFQALGVDDEALEKISSSSFEEFSSAAREDFGFDFVNERNQQYKLGFFENIIDRETGKNAELDGGLLMFRKNDALFLTTHGSEQGYLNVGDYFFEPEALVEKMYETGLIPDDIKKLYTMSCYGGRHQSFIGPNGIEVKSGHTSVNEIYGGSPQTYFKHNYFFSFADGDIIDEVKKISLDDGEFEVVHKEHEVQKTIEDYFENKLPNSERMHDDDAISNLINNFTYKVSKEPSDSKRIINKKTLQKKRLSGKGKLASAINIVSAAANITSAGTSLNKTINKSSKNINKSSKKIKSVAKSIDNSYAQQMAADISSYRYGKHMTGFVNF